MGNNLCRERIARADNSKNPIDRIIGRCAQICPANEAKSNYWEKHVLETGPPQSTQPQSTLNDGWRKVTLTVPNGKMTSEGDLGETPIAPPRRKRSSVIDRQPCGFKELFGNNVSRRSSCDSILKDDYPLSEREQEALQQKRKSKSISDFNLNEIKPTDSLSISTIRIPVTRTLSLMERAMVQQTTIPTPRPTLQRKVSRVGNKKSDKFFGENLSDCLSDDPITPEPEPTSISFTYHTISTLITPIPHTSVETRDKPIDATTSSNDVNVKTNDGISIEANEISIPVPKPFITNERIEIAKPEEDKKSSLDKKAEFLMAMLEGTNSAYMPPVEPKVMTPPRRSHLKKKSNQVTETTHGSDFNTESNDVTDHRTTTEIEHSNQPENAIEKKTILTNNKELSTKTVDNNNDDEYYKGMTPVEEPLIVPRRRSTKHICDDDHHTRKHVDHNHATSNENESENKENEPKDSNKEMIDVEKYIIQQVTNTPEKPKRDLGVYERSKQNGTEHSAPCTPVKKMDQLEKPSVPRVRHLSQENLMSNKILKTKSNDTIDLLRLKSMQKTNTNYDVTKLNDDVPLEATLKKYTSQQSFFTQELLSQIADRVYGFQDPFETLDSCDDGSSKCTPNSKLTTRKISVHRKESTVTRPILEHVHESAPINTIPIIVQMEQKDPQPIISSSIPNEIEKMVNEEVQVKKSTEQLSSESAIDDQIKLETNNFISVERDHSMVCDKNGTELNVAPKESGSEPMEMRENHVLDDIYKVKSTILNEFQKNFNNNTVEERQTESDCRLDNGNSSDDENTTDSDTTVKEVPVADAMENTIKNQVLKQLNRRGAGEKRGSIVEVDAWFLRHNDLSNLPRRGSESYVCYDTRKVFPFGCSDPGAGSEFFDSKTLSKSAENILNGNFTKAELTPQLNNHSNENPSTTDHSILLKYLK